MEPNTNPAPTKVPSSETPTEVPTTPVESTEISKPDTVSSDVQPTDKPAKSSKPLIWFLSILAILGIAAAAVFAYLYFTAPTPSPVPNNNQSTDTPTNSTTPTEPTTEETEITDTLLKKDLDEKLSILHYVNQTGPTIITTYGTHQEYPLYADGTLDDIAKLARLIYSLQNYMRNISLDEMNTIASDFGFSEKEKEAINKEVVNGDVVREHYKDVFGEEAPTPNLSSVQTKYCPIYEYDETLDLYFTRSGCGGTSPYKSMYYKTKYSKDGDHAYVYVSAATYNFENGQLYCEIGRFDDYKTMTPCDEFAETDEDGGYIFDQSKLDPENLGKYRFVFNKADDGTYYFSKVEKL